MNIDLLGLHGMSFYLIYQGYFALLLLCNQNKASLPKDLSFQLSDQLRIIVQFSLILSD